jgi:disulfide bond formation protein DsbB
MRKRVWIVLFVIVAMLALAACGRDEEPAANEAAPPAQQEVAAAPQGDPAAGEATYSQICIACHGPGGTGVQGLGKPLTTSEFVAGMSDTEFHDFIVRGRDVSDPANTTGVAMPPKGGNPALKDQDIYNIIAYIRQIQASAQ